MDTNNWLNWLMEVFFQSCNGYNNQTGIVPMIIIPEINLPFKRLFRPCGPIQRIASNEIAITIIRSDIKAT